MIFVKFRDPVRGDSQTCSKFRSDVWGGGGILLRRLHFTSKIRGLIKLQNYNFSVHLISIYNPILSQTLISSSSFIKIPMPIISVAVLILLQRSILQARKSLNSFQLFPILGRLQVFLTFM